MKKLCYSLILGMVGLTAYADQYLKVTQGEKVTYFPATSEQITFSDGKTVTIQGNTFNLSSISKIEVVDEIESSGGGVDDTLDDNTVLVEYNGATATVSYATNIASYIDATISGANVTIDQSDKVGDSTGEIIYVLKGESNDGSFTFNGSYKSTIELQGLTLTSTKGAAIDIQNGKRIEFSSKNNTVNTLVDCANGKQKAALYCKGHLELKGKGVLNVTGNTGHAIGANEYIEMKNCTVNILGSVKDALNCNQYFLMESGTLNIEKTGDDGIQVSFKDKEGSRDEEDTGNLTVKDGTIIIADITAAAAKGLKTENDIEIKGGKITIKSSAAGLWDSGKLKTKASSCLSADRNITISGATLELSASGAGGKCISCDGTFHSTGGNVTGTTTGGALVYSNGNLYQGNYTGNLDNVNSDYKSSPKVIKADTEAILEGGTFDLSTKGKNGEGIESKGNLTFDGTVVVKVRAYDDGTNSSKDTYIKGGTLDIMSIGVGDGIDANANIYISGGKLMTLGAGGAEQGIDAGDNAKVYITGGEIIAYGGNRNAAPSSSYTNAQAYITCSQTLKAGDTLTVSASGTTLATFTIPSDYPGASSGGRSNAPGGGGPGGSGGTLLISVPGMVSGTSYTVTVNGTSTTATAKTQG